MQFPGLDGVLPDVGRMEPNDWGLGFELRDAQGAALDRDAELAAHTRPLRRQRLVPLVRSGAPAWRSRASADLDFGPWALEAAPRLSDAVLMFF